MTSDGVLLYVQCLTCGAQRVDLYSAGAVAPSALSRVVGSREAADTRNALSRP